MHRGSLRLFSGTDLHSSTELRLSSFPATANVLKPRLPRQDILILGAVPARGAPRLCVAFRLLHPPHGGGGGFLFPRGSLYSSFPSHFHCTCWRSLPTGDFFQGTGIFPARRGQWPSGGKKYLMTSLLSRRGQGKGGAVREKSSLLRFILTFAVCSQGCGGVGTW